VIGHPDVYKSPASDTYIVFGEAKVTSKKRLLIFQLELRKALFFCFKLIIIFTML
jgi:hypothetical protein